MRSHKRSRQTIAGVVWLACLEHFPVQAIVAAGWLPMGTFSLRRNQISDLGNTACGQFESRLVCSPWHVWMNLAFVLLGMLMISAAAVSVRFFSHRLARLGLACLAIAGIGSVLVGLFPENGYQPIHVAGAGLHFVAGAAGLLLLGAYGRPLPLVPRVAGVACGLICVFGLILMVSGRTIGLGDGGLERLVAYPISLWLGLLGIYLIGSRTFRQGTSG